MSPDVSRYVTDQLALETSVLTEGGKVMPELGKALHAYIHQHHCRAR